MTIDQDLLKRITARPDVFGGKPIIRDMRVSVELILSLLSQGVEPENILDDYPDLELEDIRACTAPGGTDNYLRSCPRSSAGLCATLSKSTAAHVSGPVEAGEGSSCGWSASPEFTAVDEGEGTSWEAP